MTDLISLVSSRLSVEANKRNEGNKQQAASNEIKDQMDINQRDDFKKVAKEMESLFAYQLIKIMRETANTMSSEEKGFGHNTYMGLFDIEVSKLFAEKGLGLQDTIVNWLERTPNINDKDSNVNDKQD
jgi:Rod binding domain-containing protein